MTRARVRVILKVVLRSLTISIAAVILCGTPAVALGQEGGRAGQDAGDLSAAVAQQPAPPQPTPRHTGVKALFKQLVVDFKSLPAKENLYWAAGGGVLAASLHPADDNVNQAFLDASNGVSYPPWLRPRSMSLGGRATSRMCHTSAWI